MPSPPQPQRSRPDPYRCFEHPFDVDLPLRLARLHRTTPEGAMVHLSIGPRDEREREAGSDTGSGTGSVPGVGVTVADVVTGGGFVAVDGEPDTWTRARTLPDWVGPGMRVLMVGLNPSPASADHGVNFARPGNRFWPAALASGLVSTDRDPKHALTAHGIGFTDLAKRTTAKAAELAPAELAAGGQRLARLVSWLRPQACCVLGLTGWRQAIDTKAVAGWQPELLGSRPVYLMPNPSGLNAHARPEDFVRHFEAVTGGPDASP